MLKKNNCSKNDLINSCYSCVLFKKYYQHNLWSGSLEEYYNIKYCKRYIQKYIYCWIHIFLLQRFSLFFVLFLYKSPYFIKSVESGVFKRLDSHFLLSFYNNCFSFDLKGKKKIKLFVKLYLQNFLKDQLEKDILLSVIKAIKEITLNVLIRYLGGRLENIHTHAVDVKLKGNVSFKLVNTIKKIYFIGSIFFNYLIKNTFYSFISLEYTYRFLLRFINFKYNKNLKLKSFKASKLITEIFYIEDKDNALYEYHKDIHYLVESFNVSELSVSQGENIGLYQNVSALSEDLFTKNHLLFNYPVKNRNFLRKKITFFFLTVS